MESTSNSIMSFNNDSTLQNTVKSDNNVNVHELALHAMRDRCLLLQKRINTLESDNMRLKLQATQITNQAPPQDDEKHSLHQKIAELTKQKSQLMHHVFMVSCENKNLWNKISNIKGTDKQPSKEPKPLIRTNTYIHSTPKTSSNYQEKFSESSLEDISLKLINSYIQEKSQLVEQYEQMSQLQNADDDNILNVDSIGFTFMDDSNLDSLKEMRNQVEKLHVMRKEMLQQEEDLKFVLSKVETILREGYKCPSCIANSARVVTSENKEIETSDSLANFATPADSTTYNKNYNEITSAKKVTETDIDMSLEPYDKICPMCGETFQKDFSFAEFQSHVENHFIGDTEVDSTMDNFENIPNSFDNML